MLAQIKTLVIAVMIILNSCMDSNNYNDLDNNQTKKGSNKKMEIKTDTQSESKQVKLKWLSDINSIEEGKNFKLVFIPVLIGDNSKQVKLDTLHERKVHLIIVSDDLEYFTHIHPVELNNGDYEVEFVLPSGGKYKLFAEYKPEGYDKITDEFDFVVSGKSKNEKIYESIRTAYQGNDFSVRLLNAENLTAGEDQTLIAEFYKNGKKLNINSLENYLGEKAHAVMVSIRDKKFMHVHPMVMNEELNLHINFSEDDYYKLWLQFKIDEKVYTADFVLRTVESNKSLEKGNQHKHH